MKKENMPRSSALIETYSLAESDVQLRMFHTSTALRAGRWVCGSEDYNDAEACCAELKHAGPVTKSLGLYGCEIDKGTGDWD